MTSADDGAVHSEVGTLWFAHWLRALSVALVVIGHLSRTFWDANGTAATLAHLQPLPPDALKWLPGLIANHDTFHAVWPTIAVGFFFLISGFLIPLTMEGKSAGRFLANRAFRIYPVWTVGLLMIAAVFALEWWLADVPMEVSARAWIANATTVPDLAHESTLNPPGWTLFIEVKWYLFCALAMATFGLTRPWLIGGFAAALATYAAIAWHGLVPLATLSHSSWVVTQALAWDAPHLSMILIGVCFYNRLRNDWSLAGTWSCAGVSFAAMAISSWFIDDGDAFRAPKFVGYVLAVCGFALAYAYRHRFRSSGLIGNLADVSFSLYVVHFVLGMALIDALVRLTGLPLVSTVAGVAAVVLASAALHRYVEAPGIRFGKRLGARGVRSRAG